MGWPGPTENKLFFRQKSPVEFSLASNFRFEAAGAGEAPATQGFVNRKQSGNH
jgi:hypothetical protein